MDNYVLFTILAIVVIILIYLFNKHYAFGIVEGFSMMPEFKAGDYACVEPHTDVDGISISDGDFVVAQHKGAKYAVIKKVVLGNSKGDFYLTQLNKDIPSDGAISVNDYTLIGIIRNKITSYW